MASVHEDRFTGCLVGQAVGDALGFLVEGALPDDCRTYVDQVLAPRKVPSNGRGPYLFGQYTDDTQLARELVQSCLARGRFDPIDYAGRILSLFTEERIVGCGIATLQAAQRLLHRVPWDQAGTPAPSAGNGTAMRAGPVGLFCHDDPEALIPIAHDQGRITHLDPRCSAGSVAIAGAVALTLSDDPIDATSFCAQLSAWAGRFDDSVAAGLRKLPEWIALPPDAAVDPISSFGVDPALLDGWAGISPFVTSSVLWSLYAFLRTPDDYWETIGTAIRAGGDVDSTAAMAGAVSGARNGLGAIPAEFARVITDQGTWGYDEIVALMQDCHSAVMAGR